MEDFELKYIKGKIKAVKDMARQQFASVVDATKVALETNNKRLDGMNEFRQSLKDQNATFVTKSDHAILHDRLADDIRLLRESKATLEGKASMTSVYIAYAIALVSFLLTILKFFI